MKSRTGIITALLILSTAGGLTACAPPERGATEQKAWVEFDRHGITPDNLRVEFDESSSLKLSELPGSIVITGEDGTSYRFLLTPYVP